MGFRTKGEPRRINEYVSGSTVQEGDPVTLNSAGQVVDAASTTALVGVAVHSANSGEPVLVFDHPEQEFLANCDDASIDAQTDMNLNYDIVISNAPGKVSNAQVDASSGATTATLPIKVLRLGKQLGNNLGVVGNIVECTINNHQLKGGTGTAGI